jgi:hypothetical protein
VRALSELGAQKNVPRQSQRRVSPD